MITSKDIRQRFFEEKVNDSQITLFMKYIREGWKDFSSFLENLKGIDSVVRKEQVHSKGIGYRLEVNYTSGQQDIVLMYAEENLQKDDKVVLVAEWENGASEAEGKKITKFSDAREDLMAKTLFEITSNFIIELNDTLKKNQPAVSKDTLLHFIDAVKSYGSSINDYLISLEGFDFDFDMWLDQDLSLRGELTLVKDDNRAVFSINSETPKTPRVEVIISCDIQTKSVSSREKKIILDFSKDLDSVIERFSKEFLFFIKG